MTTSDDFEKSAKTTYPVSPERLAWGIGQPEGDIWASYSADTIALEGRIRKPFTFLGRAFVAVSLHGSIAEAYGLFPEQHFNGAATTYNGKINPDAGEAARNDPNGFYHGMAVKNGKETFILCGPPALFVPGIEEPKGPVQMTLF